MKIDKKCPTCGLPLRQDERWLSFASGNNPVHIFTIKVRATWCTRKQCIGERIEPVEKEQKD